MNELEKISLITGKKQQETSIPALVKSLRTLSEDEKKLVAFIAKVIVKKCEGNIHIPSRGDERMR